MKTPRIFALGPLCACAPPAVHAQDKDIVDAAIAAGNFPRSSKPHKAAGLADTLKSAGPFAVFAPGDNAFAKLPPGRSRQTRSLRGIRETVGSAPG